MNLNLKNIFLVLLWAMTSPGFAETSKISAQLKKTAKEVLGSVSVRTFEDTHHYALDILEICPPEKCVLVSLGMTNTLLDSFLRYYINKNQYDESYLKYAPFKGLVSLDGRRAEAIDGLFKKIFPSDKELAGRRLMILRNLDAGMTMTESFFPELQKYIKRNQLKWKVGAFLSFTRPEFQHTQQRFEKTWPAWDFYFQDISDQFREIKQSYRRIDYAYYRYKVVQLYSGKRLTSLYKDGQNYLGLDQLTSLFIEDGKAFRKLAPKKLQKWNWVNCREWLFDYKWHEN